MFVLLRGAGDEADLCVPARRAPSRWRLEDAEVLERIMRENGLRGAAQGWKNGSTRQDSRHTAAPDPVDRDFTAAAPNRLWVADLTRIPTGEGVQRLASVRDAFSNRVVGWKTPRPGREPRSRPS